LENVEDKAMWRVIQRVKSRLVIVPLLLAIAYLTLAERKRIASIQRRQGPNAVGIYGRRTPMADGLKLLLKETVIPRAADANLYRRAPIITFSCARRSWVVIPLGEGMVYADRHCGRIYRLAISSLGVYGIRIGGWASNSKYAFMGGLRSAAQMVSYEVSIGFSASTVLICSGTANRSQIVAKQEAIWYRVPRYPMATRFYVSTLAERNRHPFDLPEAEAELVSGYNVEYSAIGFALFFLGEYGNMILMSTRTSLLFRGGWNAIFFSSTWGLSRKVRRRLAGYVWARAAYPRYRYDQLMRLGWKVYLPVAIGWLGRTSGILIGWNGLC